MPTAPELQIVAILLESLKGSLKKLLHTAQLTSVEDLITRASQVELDEGEERRHSRPKQYSRTLFQLCPAKCGSAITTLSLLSGTALEQRLPSAQWSCQSNTHGLGSSEC